MRSNNIPLSWPYKSIPQCETMAKGACIFMLLFIGTFLCPDLGSIVNLRYLGNLRKIEQIRNYDWGSMAYATLTHFMTKLSRQSLSSLGGAPFVWQVRFGIYFGYVLVVKIILIMYGLFWLCGNGIVNFSSMDV